MPDMATTPRYRPGSTNRITVTSVREDPCAYNTDTPEALHRFWGDVIAKQPDHEPDKETVVVVMMNSRLRPYAWHRVSLGSVNECSASQGRFLGQLLRRVPTGLP
jgi:hypothetical protein